MIGAMAGARPKKMVIWLITFCAWVGGICHAQSPVKRPPRLRTTGLAWRENNQLGDVLCQCAAQAGQGKSHQAPQNHVGRRPKLSASAPWNKFIKAKPNKYADSVCCMCTGEAFSELAMPENAGR